MKRVLTVFTGMLKNSVRQVLTWRGFFFTLVLSQTVAPLISWAVWSAALPESATRPYYTVLIFTQLAVACYEQHTTSSGIYNGGFIDILLMPYPVALNVFSFATAMRLLHLLFASPLLVALFIWAWPSFGICSLLAIPALLMAAALRFLFGFGLALTAFFTQRAWGITNLGDICVMALGGGAVSLLLPGFMNFARWLPFRYMLGFPAELAAGVLNAYEIVFGFTAGAIYVSAAAMLVALVYRKGIRAYKGAEA